MLTNWQLRKYLAREVLDKDIGRKPPQRERRGPERNAAYLAWIRTLPSLVSGRGPCDACHTGSDGGMSQKASDMSCVPLTREEHQEYHQHGKRAFERRYRVNFAREVRRLNAEWRRVTRVA